MGAAAALVVVYRPHRLTELAATCRGRRGATEGAHIRATSPRLASVCCIEGRGDLLLFLNHKSIREMSGLS